MLRFKHTHTTRNITPMHYAFHQLSILDGNIYAIMAGAESNGKLQLAKILTESGEIFPISPNDTDTLYQSFSINFANKEILAIAYSDFASRRMDINQDTGEVTPCPYFLEKTDSELTTPEVLYTFSSNAYALKDDTAQNLEVAAPCRVDDNTVLFLGAPDVFSAGVSLMQLNLAEKTVAPFHIDHATGFKKALISPDRQGMYISLIKNQTEAGMYYYNFSDQSLEYLFSSDDVQKDLPEDATSLTATSVELVVQ